MIASDTPKNPTNSTPDSAVALTVTQRPAHADSMSVVAAIGDGQLVCTMQTETVELGQSIRSLTGSPDASATQVCADVIIGDCHAWEDVERAAADVQVVTFNREHVPTEFLDELIEMGHSVQPQPLASLHAQDKLLMRQHLEELGVSVPTYAAIESVQNVEAFFDRVDDAVCLKARRGGYDGYGAWSPKDHESLRTLADELLGKDVPLMAERKVALIHELLAMCVRIPSGKVKAWPVFEPVQRGDTCVETTCPAPGFSDGLTSTAEKLSVVIASELGVTGALAVELFETVDADDNPEIFVNGLAMRPHNTGHWSQDGRETSQSEQHLRVVAGLPLGSTRPIAPVIVMVNIPGDEEASDVSITQCFAKVWHRFLLVKIHWYGKDWCSGRKLNHVSLCGYGASSEGVTKTRRIANLAADYVVDGVWTDGDPANDA